MPELPDITLYLHALAPRVRGAVLEQVRLASPFLLRSVEPPIADVAGRPVLGVERIGKRIVLSLEGDRFLVLHLMIAGRLRWLARGAKVPGRVGLGAFDFSTGTLILTEAGSKRRASLYLVQGTSALDQFRRGGVDIQRVNLAEFEQALLRENHTLKRALTDPTILDGIGNAYSDEILHRAGLSPLALTSRLGAPEVSRLYQASRGVLTEWTERLIRECGDRFPEKVTAFRPGMAVHGRYREPCPDCGSPVQRIRYAENETNYCPTCQTGGRLLADRGMSRLLKRDWPRSLAELEERLHR
ncbi:MAG: DNA-formamidopyrimidine glycosylase family protein [Gemmatimonadales bacterium]